MNKHFKDAWYYLKRAGEEGRMGVVEVASPLERDLRSRLGLEVTEPEPQRTRSERVKTRFETVRGQAERMLGRAQARIEEAQDRKERTA